MNISDPKTIKQGQKIEVIFKNANPDTELYNDVYIPCCVEKIYEKWFLLDVLPHINPIRSYGLSKPYKMTISHFDVAHGNVIVRA